MQDPISSSHVWLFVVRSIQPFYGEAPVLHHAGMTDAFHLGYRPCWGIPAVGNYPHTCSNLLVTLGHEIWRPRHAALSVTFADSGCFACV